MTTAPQRESCGRPKEPTQGINPTEKLLQLSTFLGHSKIKATAVYLTITWELLSEAKRRFAQVAATAIPEVAS